jgi:hypothetical protein
VNFEGDGAVEVVPAFDFSTISSSCASASSSSLSPLPEEDYEEAQEEEIGGRTYFNSLLGGE